MNDRHKSRVWDGEEYLEDCMIDQDGILYRNDSLSDDPHSMYEDQYDCIIEQCTGLKDKKEVLIWEGDIVTMHQFLFDGNEIETQIFGVIKQGSYGLLLSRIRNPEYELYTGCHSGEGENYLMDFYGLHDESFEVIGNVNQNPELLEVPS